MSDHTEYIPAIDEVVVQNYDEKDYIAINDSGFHPRKLLIPRLAADKELHSARNEAARLSWLLSKIVEKTLADMTRDERLQWAAEQIAFRIWQQRTVVQGTIVPSPTAGATATPEAAGATEVRVDYGGGRGQSMVEMKFVGYHDHRLVFSSPNGTMRLHVEQAAHPWAGGASDIRVNADNITSER